MPRLFKLLGYSVYFWMNENNEPVHVHVSKANPTANATKLWITKDHTVMLCHNRSRIPSKDLAKIIDAVAFMSINICESWVLTFGYIDYYC